MSAAVMPEGLDARIDRVRRFALLAGGAGLVACLVLAFAVPRALFSSYLVAYLFWAGLAMGCVSITLLHHLVGGTWGEPVRRLLESGGMALLPMALLFIPIVLGLQTLYPWARPEVVRADKLLQHKAAYLNPGFFIARTVGYFVVWSTLAFLLNRWSNQQDRSRDAAPTRRAQTLSGPGLVLVFLTATFAAIDWGMSLEPKWYSSIYSVMVIVGWGLETFAFAILGAGLLARYEPAFARVVTPEKLNDLGNLMLAFVMLWAYMSFSQFLLIWSGNLVEEVPWYLRRTRAGWQYLALALILFHFFAPFLALLFRDSKRKLGVLMGIAAAILVMHLLDLSWLVLPARHAHDAPYLSWYDALIVPVAVVGIGGIWLWVCLANLKGRSLIPVNDPEIDPEHEVRPGG